MTQAAPLSASSLYFSPLSPNHQPTAGKESYGRFVDMGNLADLKIHAHCPLEQDFWLGTAQDQRQG